MAYEWKISTRDRICLVVGGRYVGSVWRHRSWRRLGHERPWHIEVLGDRWGLPLGRDNEFETADEAMPVAVATLRRVVRELQAAVEGVGND